MESDNDNFKTEADLLAHKANEILSKKCSDNKPGSPPCGLLVGGFCPLLQSTLRSAQTIIKQPGDL